MLWWPPKKAHPLSGSQSPLEGKLSQAKKITKKQKSQSHFKKNKITENAPTFPVGPVSIFPLSFSLSPPPPPPTQTPSPPAAPSPPFWCNHKNSTAPTTISIFHPLRLNRQSNPGELVSKSYHQSNFLLSTLPQPQP